MRILQYILKRLIYMLPVLFGVTVMVFVISHAIPGDPAKMIAGPKASRQAVDNIRKQHGLDKPLPVQYLRFVSGLVKGDLGISIRNHRPVTHDLNDFFPATLELTLASIMICLGVGIPLGIISAVRRNHLTDHLTRIFSVFGVSMPVFWLGLMLLLLFYRNLGWLPGSGRLDIDFFIPYNQDVEKVTDVVEKILKEDEKVLEKPAPRVVIEKFSPNYMEMKARFWVVRKHALTGRWGLNAKIKSSFDKEGIRMASPRLEITQNQ